VATPENGGKWDRNPPLALEQQNRAIPLIGRILVILSPKSERRYVPEHTLNKTGLLLLPLTL